MQPMVTDFLMSVHLWKVRNGLQLLPFCWVLRTWKFNKTCVLLSGYQRLKWDLSFSGGFRSKQIRHPRRTIFPIPSRPAVSSFLPPPHRARRRIGPRFGAANPLLMIHVLSVVSGRPKQRQRDENPSEELLIRRVPRPPGASSSSSSGAAQPVPITQTGRRTLSSIFHGAGKKMQGLKMNIVFFKCRMQEKKNLKIYIFPWCIRRT